MVKEPLFILIQESNTMDLLKMGCLKAEENRHIMTDLFTKENLVMERKKAKEFINGVMVKDMRGLF